MSWTNRPTNFSLEVVKNAIAIQKKITAEVLQQVITRSPVMDGEFRASHKVTVGKPQAGYDKGFDLAGGATIAKGLGVVATLKLGGLVYVQTNSPYGLKLENGHSKQAPKGIYALTFLSVTSKYK